MLKKIAIFIFLLGTISLFAQVTPTHDYAAPVDLVSGLSGTFGELRSNHFHSGIDIRTGGAVGKNVYSIADGYISRISVSPFGYGNALYITHTDGKMSVYAHLMQFNDTIAQWVRSEQYRQKSFAINVFLKPDQFPVTKGECIALSGNSGSSGGPHLHFEIRNNASGKVLNALNYGFTIPDQIAPSIRQIIVSPNDSKSAVEKNNSDYVRMARGTGNIYQINGNDTLSVWGNICFGVDAIDRSTGSTNANGVYSFKVFIDNELVFFEKLDGFYFEETRDINSLINYPYYIKNKIRFIQTKKQAGNRLDIYNVVKSNGIYQFEDEQIHEIVFEVGDAANNSSKLKFWVKSEKIELAANKEHEEKVSRNQGLTITEDNFILKIPKNAVYEDAEIDYTVFDSSDHNFLLPIFKLGDATIPLQKKAEITIFCDYSRFKSIPKNKLVLVNVNGKTPKPVVTSVYPLFMTANVYDLGKYTVMADTTAPIITPENIWNNKDVSHQKTIRVKITDNLTGIVQYTGTLNGHWILMEYDAKENLLEYKFDEWMKEGNNQFVLKVSDRVGNTSKIEMNLKK
ncbi:MAG: M23 family metallopeptidase [Bacteroidales bacterium]|nr:M23 family metallopeptidase [Bacteroidales bacterium]